VTRKVSTTSVKSLPSDATAKVVTVTQSTNRTQSETTSPGVLMQGVNGNNELSPWHVSPPGSEPQQPKPKKKKTPKAAPRTERRVHKITEL